MIIDNILYERPSALLHIYINDYKHLFDIDEKLALQYIKTNERFDQLTKEWYQKLSENDLTTAYRVYDDEYYFTDVWNCFVKYSRRYLRDINRSCFVDKSTFINNTQDAKIIVDVGCGIGYTTSALTQLYSNAKVYGTNLKNTKQWQFCEMMSQRYEFEMIESVAEIKKQVDVVFASEYFEHFYDPIDHAAFIIENISPKYFVIANAFNTESIGHFIKYKAYNNVVDQSLISNLFNKSLRNMGYTKLKTTLFNNKPNIWKRND